MSGVIVVTPAYGLARNPGIRWLPLDTTLSGIQVPGGMVVSPGYPLVRHLGARCDCSSTWIRLWQESRHPWAVLTPGYALARYPGTHGGYTWIRLCQVSRCQVAEWLQHLYLSISLENAICLQLKYISNDIICAKTVGTMEVIRPWSFL